MREPAWITATPPTPNGDLHVGHMAGPYVAADVLRRHLLASGRGAIMTTGLDDHQSYVPVRGLREGRGPEEVADDYGGRIERTWDRAAVEFDRIGRPRADPGYREFVQAFFARLHAGGAIVPRTRPLPYCEVCDRWLFEAFLKGICPHCGGETGGNACEPCARPNDCSDVGEPRCVACGRRARMRPCERLFLPLAPFADRLVAFWSEVEMPPRMHALCEAMLAAGLPEISVSHPGEWGLPVPVEGFGAQRIYVWLEMAAGYLLERGDGESPPPRGPIQFFGFDNGYFHAALIPALLMASDPRIPLPEAFVVNEFYRLEGTKFSTSRQHAVWAREALDQVGADVLRYHVLADRPNGRETNFSLAALAATERHLSERWDGWLNRLLAAVGEECAGAMPEESPDGAGHGELSARMRRLEAELAACYEPVRFDPRHAVALLDEAVASLAEFGYVSAHERSRAGGARRHRAALAAQLVAASELAALARPVLPNASRRLAGLLGGAGEDAGESGSARPPAPGTPIGLPAGPTFCRVGEPAELELPRV